jgi:hypothetical protein
LREALALAAARGERALELRAATSLARVLADGGRRAEARQPLADVLASFTEGFDTADVRAARALLHEIDGGRPRGGARSPVRR